MASRTLAAVRPWPVPALAYLGNWRLNALQYMLLRAIQSCPGSQMPRKPRPSLIKASKIKDPSQALIPQREAFALAIANGAKLQEAHAIAGYEGKSAVAAWKVRHAPDVDARVRWLLNERVKANTRSFVRRKKTSGDLLARVVKELEDIAFQDIREVVDFRREAQTNAAGEVIGVADVVQVRDSSKLTPAAAKAIKGVFLKSGALRVEMHDKRAALEALAKILKGDDVQPAGNITVNQVNVGQTDALDAARRVAFLLAAARAKELATDQMRTIEGETVHNFGKAPE